MDLVFDLHRELAGRREHQHAALPRRGGRSRILRGRAVDRGAGLKARATRSTFAIPVPSAPVASEAVASSHCSIGTTNAAVLPVPVAAHAIRS